MGKDEQLEELERLYQWYMLNEEFDSNEAVKWTLQDYCYKEESILNYSKYFSIE